MGDQGTQILQTKKLAFRVCDVRWVVCSHCPHADVCKSSNKISTTVIHVPTQPIIMSISHFIKKKFLYIYILLNLFFLFQRVQLFMYPISLLFGFKLLFHHRRSAPRYQADIFSCWSFNTCSKAPVTWCPHNISVEYKYR